MTLQTSCDQFFGLFELRAGARLHRPAVTPTTIPDPTTGRPLRIASIELSDRAICPSCTRLGPGGYVSFESDLRLAFACPTCQKLIWIAGA